MSRLGAGFEVFGEHIRWTDLIGNVLSLAVVWLAMRKIRNWLRESRTVQVDAPRQKAVTAS